MKSSRYDLIVIGTGFASTFFLKKYLDKKKDVKVLVLERGQLFPFQDRLQQKKGKRPDYDSTLMSYNDCIANPDKNKPWVFDPNFGGSSNCWWGATLRFMPNDFKIKSKYGVGLDWPLGYDDLEAYYTEAEEIMSISGPEQTPFLRSRPYLLPSHTLSTVDRLLQKEYGLNYFSQPTARASRAVGERGECCSSYTCSVCPNNSKFTIENSMGSAYNDDRVELVMNAQVYSFLLEGDQVRKVLFTKDALQQEAEGEVVALGANAIFNAHVLLASGDKNIFTGKGLSDQRGFYVNVYLKNFENVGGSSAITANGYMLYDGAFRSEAASCIIESHNGPFIRNEQGKWRHMARFKFVLEDVLDDKNFVALSNDPLKPAITYASRSNYINKGRDLVLKRIDSLFACLPVEEIFPDQNFQSTEAHILSTARMGISEADSVVDHKQIHHRYRNLFVLGGSSFPSITAANPSLTISALSLRSADLSF